MKKEGRVTVAASLPYHIREFIRNEAEQRNQTVSEYLRELLKQFYEVKRTLDELEKER